MHNPLLNEKDIEFENAGTAETEFSNCAPSTTGNQRGKLRGKVVFVQILKRKLDDNTDPLQVAGIFLQEAKRMMEFQHSRIVKFEGFVLKTCWIVMEWMDLGSLATFLAQLEQTQRQNDKSDAVSEKFPWIERLVVANDVAAGMEWLHAKTRPNGKRKAEMFHMNLNSSNVLLYRENTKISKYIRAKITGFGNSFIRQIKSTKLSELASASASNKNRGTSKSNSAVAFNKQVVVNGDSNHVFVAPELQQSSRFTKSSDVYSFGVILLHLSTLMDARYAIKDFRDKMDRVHGCPDNIKKTAEECLRLNPRERPSFTTISIYLASFNEILPNGEYRTVFDYGSLAQFEADEDVPPIPVKRVAAPGKTPKGVAIGKSPLNPQNGKAGPVNNTNATSWLSTTSSFKAGFSKQTTGDGIVVEGASARTEINVRPVLKTPMRSEYPPPRRQQRKVEEEEEEGCCWFC